MAPALTVAPQDPASTLVVVVPVVVPVVPVVVAVVVVPVAVVVPVVVVPVAVVVPVVVPVVVVPVAVVVPVVVPVVVAVVFPVVVAGHVFPVVVAVVFPVVVPVVVVAVVFPVVVVAVVPVVVTGDSALHESIAVVWDSQFVAEYLSFTHANLGPQFAHDSNEELCPEREQAASVATHLERQVSEPQFGTPVQMVSHACPSLLVAGWHDHPATVQPEGHESQCQRESLLRHIKLHNPLTRGLGDPL